jgi:hypothetical protein
MGIQSSSIASLHPVHHSRALAVLPEHQPAVQFTALQRVSIILIWDCGPVDQASELPLRGAHKWPLRIETLITHAHIVERATLRVHGRAPHVQLRTTRRAKNIHKSCSSYIMQWHHFLKLLTRCVSHADHYRPWPQRKQHRAARQARLGHPTQRGRNRTSPKARRCLSTGSMCAYIASPPLVNSGVMR